MGDVWERWGTKSPLWRKLGKLYFHKDLWDRHVPSNDPRNNCGCILAPVPFLFCRVENQGGEGQCNTSSTAEKNKQPIRQSYCLVCKQYSSVFPICSVILDAVYHNFPKSPPGCTKFNLVPNKGGFFLSRKYFYVRTHVKFTCVNKIEAMYRWPHVNVKVEHGSSFTENDCTFLRLHFNWDLRKYLDPELRFRKHVQSSEVTNHTQASR